MLERHGLLSMDLSKTRSMNKCVDVRMIQESTNLTAC